MITAHLPAGYLLGRAALRYTPPRPWVMTAALVGAVLPDLDLIWFYIIDNRAVHHHTYWVHKPFFWLILAVVTQLVLRRIKPDWLPVSRTFFASVALHLLLDTVAGDIAWAWPFSDRFFALVTVPATYDHYIVSFVLHWTFLLEIAIWVTAASLYWRDRA